ncbi:bacteriocin [Natronogracilivirgula saccharolytica]|uniref:Bacteriocin n=1 Tax=Natronogracilivirga saccharolytica TaxID=2812953 RepID=A0A8J7UWZ7_9BACT|nr:bacteriocin [Natronogracilivirga saccharolytica]
MNTNVKELTKSELTSINGGDDLSESIFRFFGKIVGAIENFEFDSDVASSGVGRVTR